MTTHDDHRLRLGIDAALARHERLVDLLGPLVRPRMPLQWVHRPHGLRLAADYAETAGSWFEATTDLATCDVAVLPFCWDQVLLDPSLAAPARQFCERAAHLEKIVLVFVDGDDHVPSPGDNAVVFRTSLDRRRQGPLDVALPAWIPDPGRQPPRPPQTTPTVGFCGQAYPLGLPAGRVLKRMKFELRALLTDLGVVERIGKHPAFRQRPRAVRALARSTEVDPRIILRPAMTRLDLDTDLEQQLRLEYVAALADADYVLAVRGEGNYSFRLYETLAAARIPVYVDTGAVLPLESQVPWDALCVTVPEHRIDELGSIVASAHTRGLDVFTARQEAARSAWERWLSMRGFFGALRAVLLAQLSDAPVVDPRAVAISLG